MAVYDIEQIPVFPEVVPLSLAYKRTIDKLNFDIGNNGSALNFTNLFILDLENQTGLSRFDDGLVIRQVDLEGGGYSLLTKTNYHTNIQRLIDLGVTRLDNLFCKLDGADVDHDNLDYMYHIGELSKLTGKDYSGMRHKLSKFKTSYDVELIKMRPGDTDAIWELMNRWQKEFKGQMSDDIGISADYELLALEKLLAFYDLLEIEVLILKEGTELVGFCVVEKICGNTVLIHFFKTNLDYQGSAEWLFHSLTQEYRDLEFINFEQDLGIEGLREFKRRLRPSAQIMNYSMRIGNNENLQ